MKFDDDLRPTKELRAHGKLLNARIDEREKLAERARKQRLIVSRESTQLGALKAKNVLSKSTDPEAIREYESECNERDQRLKDERALLSAIEKAFENATKELSGLSASLEHAIADVIGVAATKTQKVVEQELRCAVQEFIACRVAVDGPLAVMGAQYEIELLTKDTSFLGEMDKRIATAKQGLREQVTSDAD